MGRLDIQRLHPTWEIDPAIDNSGWNKHTRYEGLEQARQRAKRVSSWLASHPWPDEARVMLVIHADFKIRMLEAVLDDLDLEDKLESVINTAWTAIRFSQGQWQLDTYNAHGHLENHMITC